MPDFYKILKDTRIQRGIKLDEIQTRTKINIIFLKAIENGKFDLLPEPYIRLFLRAYSIEIGLDPEKLLNQFEQFIDGKVTKLKKGGKGGGDKSFEKQLTTPEPKSEKEIIHPNKSPKINRGKAIKSILLLSCWIFGLIIIHKIANSPEVPPPPTVQLSATEFINILYTNYKSGDKEEHQFEFIPPYSLSIKTVGQLTVFTSPDSTSFSRIILNSGEHKSFYTDSILTLILEHTQNVTLSIKGESEEITLDQFQNFLDPVKIRITDIPPVYSVMQYTKKK